LSEKVPVIWIFCYFSRQCFNFHLAG
jgi:hypothetical protein